MKLKTVCLLSVSLYAMLSAMNAFTQDENTNGGVTSLRGNVDLSTQKQPEELKIVPKDRESFARDYLHQPPLIPHQTRDYKINTHNNKCLFCHSWDNYRASGATKISMTHFETRDGKQLSDISPRRYFCTQCHVTQADAKPIVENEFQPIKKLDH